MCLNFSEQQTERSGNSRVESLFFTSSLFLEHNNFTVESIHISKEAITQLPHYSVLDHKIRWKLSQLVLQNSIASTPKLDAKQ